MFIGGDYEGHPSHIGRKCVFNTSWLLVTTSWFLVITSWLLVSTSWFLVISRTFLIFLFENVLTGFRNTDVCVYMCICYNLALSFDVLCVFENLLC